YIFQQVAKGYTQIHGIDSTNLFAPTLSKISFRTFLAVATSKNLKLRPTDIKKAFIHGNID
ncbi:hypothetical protein HMI55_005072, partial [Coelomomyces lativittatus]